MWKIKKYRIVQSGNIFYPQWRYSLFNWFNYYKELDGYCHYRVVKFDSYSKAKMFIESNELRYYKVELEDEAHIKD